MRGYAGGFFGPLGAFRDHHPRSPVVRCRGTFEGSCPVRDGRGGQPAGRRPSRGRYELVRRASSGRHPALQRRLSATGLPPDDKHVVVDGR
jgi:hypothetical protein